MRPTPPASTDPPGCSTSPAESRFPPDCASRRARLSRSPPMAGTTSSSRTPRSTGSKITTRSIRRLFTALRPGGQLAFQVPAMHHAVSHSLPDELARTEAVCRGVRGLEAATAGPRARRVCPAALSNRLRPAESSAGRLSACPRQPRPGRRLDEGLAADRIREAISRPSNSPASRPPTETACSPNWMRNVRSCFPSNGFCAGDAKRRGLRHLVGADGNE